MKDRIYFLLWIMLILTMVLKLLVPSLSVGDLFSNATN
jgi:hypothetical protein